MLAGLGVTVAYMAVNAPPLRALFGMDPGQTLWFGIQPLSAGVFGVPLGAAVVVIISMLTPAARPAAARAQAPGR
jgi:cation/acetate symporter